MNWRKKEGERDHTWVLHQCQVLPRRTPPKTHCFHVLPLWMKGKAQGLPMSGDCPVKFPRFGETVTHGLVLSPPSTIVPGSNIIIFATVRHIGAINWLYAVKKHFIY